MENATKGLLIATAVLIVIVIIALGVSLLKNSSETNNNAEKTGKAISIATDEAIRKYQKSYISKEEFNDYFENIKANSANQFINGILNDRNIKIREQVEIIGYIYKEKRSDFFNESKVKEARLSNIMEAGKYWENTTLPYLLNNNKLIALSNPKDIAAVLESLTEFYNSKTGNSMTVDEFRKLRLPTSSFWFFGFDKDGYVNKACCIYSIEY